MIHKGTTLAQITARLQALSLKSGLPLRFPKKFLSISEPLFERIFTVDLVHLWPNLWGCRDL